MYDERNTRRNDKLRLRLDHNLLYYNIYNREHT